MRIGIRTEMRIRKETNRNRDCKENTNMRIEIRAGFTIGIRTEIGIEIGRNRNDRYMRMRIRI